MSFQWSHVFILALALVAGAWMAKNQPALTSTLTFGVA